MTLVDPSRSGSSRRRTKKPLFAALVGASEILQFERVPDIDAMCYACCIVRNGEHDAVMMHP